MLPIAQSSLSEQVGGSEAHLDRYWDAAVIEFASRTIRLLIHASMPLSFRSSRVLLAVKIMGMQMTQCEEGEESVSTRGATHPESCRTGRCQSQQGPSLRAGTGR